jgi:hypothetical protein
MMTRKAWKIFFAITITVALVLMLAACGGSAPEISASESQAAADPGSFEAPEPEPETEPAPEAEAEPMPEPEPVATKPDASYSGDFAIEGKWKNVGETGIGQAQPGAIIIFDGMNCNLISPSDTYAFYEDGGDYRLDWTTVLGSSGSQTVHVIDEDHIEMHNGEARIEFERVG